MENVGTKEKPDEREQNPDAQLIPMRVEMNKRGWADGGEFIDRQTGTDMYRPDFKRMFEKAGMAAEKGFDCIVMVARADRFSRFRPIDALIAICELQERNIKFYSLAEPYASDIPENSFPEELRLWMLHHAFINSNAESKRISERTKAGIAAKKAKGEWKGGRPVGSKDSYSRGEAQPKIEITPSDMFKPSV